MRTPQDCQVIVFEKCPSLWIGFIIKKNIGLTVEGSQRKEALLTLQKLAPEEVLLQLYYYNLELENHIQEHNSKHTYVQVSKVLAGSK